MATPKHSGPPETKSFDLRRYGFWNFVILDKLSVGKFVYSWCDGFISFYWVSTGTNTKKNPRKGGLQRAQESPIAREPKIRSNKAPKILRMVPKTLKKSLASLWMCQDRKYFQIFLRAARGMYMKPSILSGFLILPKSGRVVKLSKFEANICANDWAKVPTATLLR
jgi:hypothetical protein